MNEKKINNWLLELNEKERQKVYFDRANIKENKKKTVN